MDSRSVRAAHRVPGSVDIPLDCAREARNDRPPHRAGDLLDRIKIARARDREACLNDIDTECIERVGDFELFRLVHAEPGGLLAIAERGVEDADRTNSVHWLISSLP